eukprot:scaffold17694_cov118-Isochrysis_galbana.AAC.2
MNTPNHPHRSTAQIPPLKANTSLDLRYAKWSQSELACVSVVAAYAATCGPKEEPTRTHTPRTQHPQSQAHPWGQREYALVQIALYNPHSASLSSLGFSTLYVLYIMAQVNTFTATHTPAPETARHKCIRPRGSSVARLPGP